MRRFFYENSLSLTMLGLFLVFLAGQSVTGWVVVYNTDQEDHHQPAISYGTYLRSGHFLEAVFERCVHPISPEEGRTRYHGFLRA